MSDLNLIDRPAATMHRSAASPVQGRDQPAWPGPVRHRDQDAHDDEAADALFAQHRQALAAGQAHATFQRGDAESLLWEACRTRVLQRRYRLLAQAGGPTSVDLVGDLHALVTADGLPLAWWERHVSPSVPRPSLLLPYAIPHVTLHAVHVPVPLCATCQVRLQDRQQAFVTESFMDELAARAGADPCAYRRALMPEGSRHRRVLDTAARLSGWGTPLPAGRGRGVALVESGGAVVAEIVEASPGQDGTPRVHRVVVVADCGGLRHTESARARIQAALRTEVRAATSGWGAMTHWPPSFQEPVIEVHMLSSEAPWGGVDEVGAPPFAPALCNALFAAGSPRIRSLPLPPHLDPAAVRGVIHDHAGWTPRARTASHG